MNSLMEVTRPRNRLHSIAAATGAAVALLTAAGSAVAEPELIVETLEYECVFPIIGSQVVSAEISAFVDLDMEVGETDPFEVSAIATLPEDVRSGMDAARVNSIEGTAIAETTIELVSRTLDIDMVMDIPQYILEPGTGPFDLPASGMAPSVTLTDDDIGEGILRVGDLHLDIIMREPDGDIGLDPVGDFEVTCAQTPGQEDKTIVGRVVPAGNDDDEVPFPEISLDKQALDFGSVVNGLTAQENIVVSNIGNVPYGIQNMTVEGEDAGVFDFSHDCTTLDTGESCSIGVTYYPSGVGQQSATLAIAPSDEQLPVTEVPLTGTSVTEIFPEIAVNPASLDFGGVPVGVMKDLNVTVSNSGGEHLTIEGISLSGPHASDFMFTDDCTTLSEAQTCDITVTYTSSVNENRNATLNIATNDPENGVKEVPLSVSKMAVTPPTIVEVTQRIVGDTFIAASDGTMDLAGSIDAALNLSDSTFVADLTLEPTEGTFPVTDFFLFRALEATAQVEFIELEPTVGIIENDQLSSSSLIRVHVKNVDLGIWGSRMFSLGGGDECTTSEPVIVELNTPQGEEFIPLEGGRLEGTYELPPLENCGFLTDILNLYMAGPGNTINLTLEAQL